MSDSNWVVVLDPSEVATPGRSQLSIYDTTGGILVGNEGIDWGDAQVTQFLADQEWGSTPVDYRVPNRTVVIPLMIGGNDSTSIFNTARRALERKVALIQREGGWIKRATSVGTVYADVMGATLQMHDQWGATGALEAATLTLICLPDFYGDEVSLDLVHCTGFLTGLQKVSSVDYVVPGDYPARCRIVVSETDAINQATILWGFRSRNYSSDTTAALAYDASDMTVISPSDVSGVTVRTNNLVPNVWTPSMKTDVSGTSLNHVGTYRVWARAQARNVFSGQEMPRIRLVWGVGDLAHPVFNDTVSAPTMNTNSLIDLGVITIPPAISGSGQWKGVIQTMVEIDPNGSGLCQAFYIEKIFFQPIDESAGLVVCGQDGTLIADGYTASDSLDYASGNLVGKTPPVGPVWTNAGIGSSTDFVGVSGAVQRATNDGSDVRGDYVNLTTAPGFGTVLQVDVQATTWVEGWQGLLAKWKNATNYAYAIVNIDDANRQVFLQLNKVLSGTTTAIGQATISTGVWQPGAWYTLRLAFDSVGSFWVWFGPQGGNLKLYLSGQDTDMFNGNTTTLGLKAGILDFGDRTTCARLYQNFSVWPLTPEAAVFGLTDAEVRTEGVWREDTTGTVLIKQGTVSGDNPRVPPGGMEGRNVEMFVKTVRGAVGVGVDWGDVDTFDAQLFVRPCYLFRP